MSQTRPEVLKKGKAAFRVTPVFDIAGTASSRESSPSSDRSSFFVPPQSAASSTGRDIVVREYLAETGLVHVMKTWMKQLSNEAELQYNPYPMFCWQARQYAERFRMFGEDSRTILEKIENQVIGMGGYGCRTQDSPACWGLATVLRSVNAESIIPFDWLLSSMGTDVSLTDSEDYSYIVQKPIPVLVGPCAFVGSVYPLSDLESINIRMEYSISGPEEVHAVEIFSKVVICDILLMRDDEVHIVLGVNVPVEDMQQKGRWVKQFWTCGALCDKQDHFLSLLKSAALAQKVTETQCMFRLQPESRQYRRGCKQYKLNFTKTDERRDIKKKRRCF